MILTNKFYLNKGVSFMGVLFSLSIFSMMLIVFHRWQHHQHLRVMAVYQQRQALQIAKNQQQRQLLRLPCEEKIHQNGISFSVQCSQGEVSVRTARFHFTFY